MSGDSIRINERCGALFSAAGVSIIDNEGEVIAMYTPDDMEHLTTAYGDYRWRNAPLNTSSVSSIIQQTAGDGPLVVRSLLRTPQGYSLRVQMTLWPAIRWTVRTWGDWYKAQEESRLEAARRAS